MDGRPRIGIRTATDSYERALAAIDRSTWSPQVDPGPLWPLDTPFFNEQTSPGNVLVAQESGCILGYVKLRPSPMPASSGHVQEINGFAVAPHHQGRGVGNLLLDAALELAVEREARRITLRVLGSNTRAQAIYLAHGFRIEGRLVGQFLIQDHYVDDILMALGSGGSQLLRQMPDLRLSGSGMASHRSAR
ncbi:GNAT family N-acetyltransferase [Nocardia sp. NPDC058705]|uniref:GNAT family N-acetyltransferase n=1 Tax=Nocardia sp. NPDC058705 TaxID=3346609 RepID=UPI00367B0091